jgi:hypothetical protein
MSRSEAEQLAAVVWSRIHPRSWWDGERHAQLASESVVGDAAKPRRLKRWIPVILFPFVLVAVSFAVPTRKHHARRDAKPAPQEPWPHREDFQKPRDYAVAVTSFVLRSGPQDLVDQPICGARVTWAEWTCSAHVKVHWGSFAGRSMAYKCSRVAYGGVKCGPARPMPLGSSRAYP